MAKSRQVTLLDVCQAVSEVAANDRETLATGLHLISNGRVRLCADAMSTMRDLLATTDIAA